MGQAKSRGSQVERAAEAKKRERAKFPETVKCNNCQAELSEINPMDVRGFAGLRLAGAARCEACESTTWVLDGTHEAIAQVSELLDEEHGGGAQYGFALKP
jgi:uncharacterized protein with PIN domain